MVSAPIQLHVTIETATPLRDLQGSGLSIGEKYGEKQRN